MHARMIALVSRCASSTSRPRGVQRRTGAALGSQIGRARRCVGEAGGQVWSRIEGSGEGKTPTGEALTPHPSVSSQAWVPTSTPRPPPTPRETPRDFASAAEILTPRSA
jgi:hypothetical protein